MNRLAIIAVALTSFSLTACTSVRKWTHCGCPAVAETPTTTAVTASLLGISIVDPSVQNSSANLDAFTLTPGTKVVLKVQATEGHNILSVVEGAAQVTMTDDLHNDLAAGASVGVRAPYPARPRDDPQELIAELTAPRLPSKDAIRICVSGQIAVMVASAFETITETDIPRTSSAKSADGTLQVISAGTAQLNHAEGFPYAVRVSYVGPERGRVRSIDALPYDSSGVLGAPAMVANPNAAPGEIDLEFYFPEEPARLDFQITLWRWERQELRVHYEAGLGL